MSSAWVGCQKCGEQVPLRDWPNKHVCGVLCKNELKSRTLSHREILDYYSENPDEIEKDFVVLIKDLPVFRSRIDIVGRDTQKNVCLVKVVHKSKKQYVEWVKQLQKHRSYLRMVGKLVFHIKTEKMEIRLLLKKTGKDTEDVTYSSV